MTAGLHVDERGPADVDPELPHVVFIHGVMDRSTGFDRARRRLADLVTVAYDRRGYARSRHVPVAGCGFNDHVADLLTILGNRPQVVLAGHSYGGDVALAAAIARPQQVRAVVVFEAPMPWTDWWPASAGGSTLAVAEADGPDAAAEAFMRRIVSDRLWERLPRETRAERREEGEALLVDLRSIRNGRPFDPSRCSVPTLFVGGSESPAHQRRSVREMASHIEGARTALIAGSGHGGHTSHPDEFASLVREVVQSVSEGRPVRPVG